VCAACCWAVGSHLFGRIGATTRLPAAAMNLGKCATAGVLFAVTSAALTGRLAPHLPPRALGWLALSGVVGLALGDEAYFRAILTIGVRRALLLLSMAPVFTAVGGALFLGEALTIRDAVAIGAVLLGVAVVVYEQEPSGKRRALTASGLLFGLGAGLGQAIGSLMSRAGMNGTGVSALDAALVRLSAGLVAILLLAAARRQLTRYARALAAPRVILVIAGSAAVGTYAGIWLSQYAIGHANSTAIASTLLATSPIFALPLGRWLNAEPITSRAVAGTALACAGLSLLTFGQR
jgi:drug/metabolite transporter (DMT)-like permease